MDNTSFTDAFPIKTLNKKSNPIATLITDYIWLPALDVSTKSHDIPIDHPVFASPSRPSFEPLACDRPTPPAGVVPGNPMICAIITHDEKKQRFNGCWLNTNTAVTSIFNIFLTFLSICWFHRLWNFWLQTPSCSKPRISIFGFGFIGPAF